jgi:hypothetical protein
MPLKKVELTCNSSMQVPLEVTTVQGSTAKTIQLADIFDSAIPFVAR